MIDKNGFDKQTLFSSFIQFIIDHSSINSSICKTIEPMDMFGGVFEFDNSYIHLSLRFDENDTFDHYELIIANNSSDKKRMVVLTADGIESELIKMDISGMRENVIIDLNFGGRRWEGGELKGKPFGFGYEYSEDDNLVYEGFVFEGMKVCFGKEWNDDGNNNCLMYEGCYCNDERCGNGISYDLNGNVDFEGEWTNNHGMTENETKLNVYSLLCIEMFLVNDRIIKGKNITSLHFSPLLLRLKQIEISDHSCNEVRGFILDGLPNLQIVKIGSSCFRAVVKDYSNDIFRITNCPNLRELDIGYRSYCYFHSFELSNLNSLQSIYLGDFCFMNANEFSLLSK